MAVMYPETIKLQKGSSSAEVHTFGATLLSWKPGGIEALFVSKKSFFDDVKPIRGGVPIVFPQFGPWELGPQHGFARRMTWTVGKVTPDLVTLILEDSDTSKEMWKHKFRLVYTVTLVSDKELKMDTKVTNIGERKFDFTFLLHSYFSVPAVQQCQVVSLKGCRYIDKMKRNAECIEENEEVQLSEATDRIYEDTPSLISVKHVSGDRTIQISTNNLPDTVLWNPWDEGAKKMQDFGNDEWERMICVEAGSVAKPLILQPSETFKCSQTFFIS